ncbi:hypothetical protein BU17DRAFT_39215 [Hysterangium stoloniferum]|nr:hypothetical protein BU17DRAFT_39215 [Hysterangium stoloniferum]
MPLQFERQLGESELSYYLPSRADGVNDMYLHLGFRAPSRFVTSHRVALAWAIIRGRHPLLVSKVVMQPGQYEDVRFVYTSPESPLTALEDAQANFELQQSSKDVIIDSYLNGARILSNDRLSYLILSSHHSRSLLTPPGTPAIEEDGFFTIREDIKDFDLLICAAHFLGDGMALHATANDLFSLLAGSWKDSGKPASDMDLREMLESEWQHRWGEQLSVSDIFPPALEARLPAPLSSFQRIGHQIEFQCSQTRLVGGHSFPRAAPQTGRKRHTIVPTVSFDPQTTKNVLMKCKKEGVSISHLLFALCNLAWAKIGNVSGELPMMMYSALNLRPYLLALPSAPLTDSYWYLAVGYFNVVLPSLIRGTLFHRARLAKQQCIFAAKTPLLLARTRCMALERGRRARTFAALDDAPPKVSLEVRLPPTPTTSPSPNPAAQMPKTPSVALLGLSLLGNLDGTYKHASYPELVLHTLTTGSRQRAGGLLVFGYTFAGKLWVSLGYDEGAFDDSVGVWWKEVVKGMAEVGL